MGSRRLELPQLSCASQPLGSPCPNNGAVLARFAAGDKVAVSSTSPTDRVTTYRRPRQPSDRASCLLRAGQAELARRA